MTSGIYLLSFHSGRHYVGKSVDIERRWEQHFKAMESGKAAKNMQEEYNKHGFPVCNIIKECHPDHLDVLEPIYIEAFLKDGSLNSDIPTVWHRPSIEEIDLVNEDEASEYWMMSTIQHLVKIKELENKLFDKDEEYGTLIHEIEGKYDVHMAALIGEVAHWKNLNVPEEMKKLEEELTTVKEENARLKARTLWQRIFNK
jgi:hypothetical protein